MLREALAHIVASAVSNLVKASALPGTILQVPIEILDTRQPEHGDYACNFALAASKAAGMNPRQVAEMLRAAVLQVDEACADEPNSRAQKMVAEGSPAHADRRAPLIHQIDIAGPGFLNLKLKPEAVAAYVSLVLQLGDSLPKLHTPDSKLQTQKINVEFVSVNPNGPITVGSARGAAFGDTLCRVLEAAGNQVHREYYVNDGVNSEQMRQFAMSVMHYCFTYGVHDIGFLGNATDHSRGLQLNNEFIESLGVGHAVDNESFFRSSLAAFLDQVRNSPEEPWRRERADRLKQRLDDSATYVQTTMERYKMAWLDDRFRPPDQEPPYRGEYVLDVAKSLLDSYGEDHIDANLSREDILWFQQRSQDLMLKRQGSDLETFGVSFDTWFSEQSLHDSGEVAKCIDELTDKGAADEEPYRTVLKLGKGGVIEAVTKEPQVGDAEDGDDETPSSKLETPNALDGTAATLWLRSTKFGDDMDRVLRRRDARLTYIASDVAYHKDKLTDGSGLHRTGPVDKLITILGPDHHGYIARLQAVVAALLEEASSAGSQPAHGGQVGRATHELDENEALIYRSAEERDACLAALEEARKRLEVVIFQIVRFVKDGKPAPMRKRDGNIYELRDLIDELGAAVAATATKAEQQRIGADVARFFYLMRSHDTHMDFDIDLATKQSDENPVFYVQYAHARICGVLRKAQEAVAFDHPSADTSLLTHPKETALIEKILDLPWEVGRCAQDYGVHRLTTYAVELARTYHHFYDACRVIQPDQPELSKARLALCEAARIALRSTLDLCGVSAPERMEREAAEV